MYVYIYMYIYIYTYIYTVSALGAGLLSLGCKSARLIGDALSWY